MKQYRFSLKDECMKEVDHPNATREILPVPKEYLNEFEDGKVYTEDEFETKHIGCKQPKCSCGYMNYESNFCINVLIAAIPKQNVIEDYELWSELVSKVAAANICNVTPDDVRGIVSWKDKIIDVLQKYYAITRK